MNMSSYQLFCGNLVYMLKTFCLSYDVGRKHQMVVLKQTFTL